MQDKTENRLSPALWYVIFGFLNKQEFIGLSMTCRLINFIVLNAPGHDDRQHDIVFPIAKRRPLLKLQEEDFSIHADTFWPGNS